MMTKKNFEAMAEILRTTGPVRSDGDFSYIVAGLIDYFASENPNFDREQFIKACGI